MKISYNWLQQYFDKKLPVAKELSDLINSHVFEVESVEAVDKDTVFDIKVMPDRAHYALCHRGIAREVRAITGLEMKKDILPAIVIDKNVGIVKLIVEETSLCSRSIMRRIEGITISESPSWLKDSLEAVDMRSINNVVDATNYVMLDIGQPLHAFDADKIVGSIVVRKAKKGERLELLPERVLDHGVMIEKERSYELDDSVLVLADDIGPLDIAGVKGGKRAEINSNTKNIVMTACNFNPVSIRRSSTKYSLRNDASKRFENEIIPELAEIAMNQVTLLTKELSVGAKIGPITDIFSTPTKPWGVSISADFISEKLGTKVSGADLKEVLKRYDCVAEESGDTLTVTPPLDRLDLKIPEDFVDEVARVRGYETLVNVLPPALPANTAAQIRDDKTFFWSEKVKNTLVNLGFSEALLYSLVSTGFYEITYPLANDKSCLRESIVQKMKEVLAINVLNADLLGLDIIKMFEIGKVFLKEGEKTVLCIGVKNIKKSKKKEPEILKETLAEIEKIIGTKIDAKIDPKIADNIIEIDFDLLTKTLATGSILDLNFQALPRDQKYHPFSPYPFIVRDIAVFVPDTVIGDGVWKAIKQGMQEAGATDLLVRDSLFDVFKKDGKVSYAYRLVFQSYEKTLTDEEVNKIMEKIYAEVKERGWEVR